MNQEWRRRRIARNEAMFRDINDRLEEGLRQVRHSPERQDFLCECGNRDCEQIISLSFEEYEVVRQDSRRFAVVPGHVFPQTEHVVSANERFQVVEKTGDSIALADESDLRSPGEGGLRE